MAQQGGTYKVPSRFTFSTGRSASASQSAQKDDEDSIDEKSAAVNDTSVSEKALVKTVARTEYEDRDWVVVPSNPEDEPEEKPEPREVSVRAYAQVARFSTEFKLSLGWGKGGSPTPVHVHGPECFEKKE